MPGPRPPFLLDKLGRIFVALSYLMFLGGYAGAAAAYGLTRETPLAIYSQWGLLTFGLWGAGHLLRRQSTRAGLGPWILALALALFGWSVTLVGVVNEANLDGRLLAWGQWLPEGFRIDWGTVNAALSWAAMLRTLALLGGMLIAIEMWRHPGWSQALVGTLLVTGFGMVLFFLLQRTVGEPFILHGLDHRTVLAFATFRYHGNGASFLNLFWPIFVGIAVHATVRQTLAWPVWWLPAACSFAACFLNISKAGNLLAVAGAGLLACALAPAVVSDLKRQGRQLSRRTIILALIPLLVIGMALPFAVPWQRWEYLASSVTRDGTDGRLEAYRVFWQHVPEAGASGFGPGTFKTVQNAWLLEDSPLQTYWVAHQDYLQTMADWGFIGSLLWAMLLVPPGIFLLHRTISRETAPPPEDLYRISWQDWVAAFWQGVPRAGSPMLAGGALVAFLLTALHAMIDFPMQIGSIQLYFLVVCALGWSYARPGRTFTRG